MKGSLVYNVNASLRDIIFPSHRVSGIHDISLIAAETCRELQILSPDENAAQNESFIIIKAGRMRRLFFYSPDKYYSISVPVSIDVQETRVTFKYSGVGIDSEYWSKLIEMMRIDSTDILDVYQYYSSEFDTGKIPLDISGLYQLFMTHEYGYVRYDYDPYGYKIACDNQSRHKHPLNHVDVHLGTASTFKLGLHEKITPCQFIKILDNSEDRLYLSHANDKRK